MDCIEQYCRWNELRVQKMAIVIVTATSGGVIDRQEAVVSESAHEAATRRLEDVGRSQWLKNRTRPTRIPSGIVNSAINEGTFVDLRSQPATNNADAARTGSAIQ